MFVVRRGRPGLAGRPLPAHRRRGRRRRRARAAPRQHPPGDRLDHRPGPAARRARRVQRDHPILYDGAPRTRSRSPSSASSGGGSTATTSTTTAPSTSSPPTRWSIPVGRDDRAQDPVQRRDPLVLDPGAQRQEGRRAGPHPRAGHRRPTSPASSRASAPSTAASPTASCACRSRPSTRPTTTPGSSRMTTPPEQPDATGELAGRPGRSSSPSAPSATRSTASTPTPTAPYTVRRAPPDPTTARASTSPMAPGNAPNLTHLMIRDYFAGGLLRLYEDLPEATAASTGLQLEVGWLPNGTPDENNIKRWLRNPEEVKPMDPDNNQGMPNLQPDRGADRPAGRLPADAQVTGPRRHVPHGTHRGTPTARAAPSGARWPTQDAQPLGVFARPSHHTGWRVVGHHRRSQEDRHHVRRRVVLLPARGRRSRRC